MVFQCAPGTISCAAFVVACGGIVFGEEKRLQETAPVYATGSAGGADTTGAATRAAAELAVPVPPQSLSVSRIPSSAR